MLHGKEMTLEKPLIVLEKRRNVADETVEDMKTEYSVRAVIKKKLLFKSRPKPIVTNVPKLC